MRSVKKKVVSLFSAKLSQIRMRCKWFSLLFAIFLRYGKIQEGWSHKIKIHDSHYKWIDSYDFLGISLLWKRVYWRRIFPDEIPTAEKKPYNGRTVDYTGTTWRKQKQCQTWGSVETWTRILGFRVQSANHYTTEPFDFRRFNKLLHSRLTFAGYLKTSGKLLLKKCPYAFHKVAWPSSLRRWLYAPVISMTWVGIPPLPIVIWITNPKSNILTYPFIRCFQILVREVRLKTSSWGWSNPRPSHILQHCL